MLDVKIGTVHEDVLLDRMAVQIDVKAEALLMFHLHLSCKLEKMKSFREGIFA